MGCDMHGWVEVRHEGRWIAHGEIPEQGQRRVYERFAELACVRGEGGHAPRGFPDDASETTRYHFREWGGDAHTPSWLPIAEFIRICMKTEWEPRQHRMYDFDYVGVELDYEQASADDFRVVFWFDN